MSGTRTGTAMLLSLRRGSQKTIDELRNLTEEQLLNYIKTVTGTTYISMLNPQIIRLEVNREQIRKIVGALFIILANIMMLVFYKE